MREVSTTGDTLVATVGALSGGGMLPATGTTTGARPLSGYVTTLLQTGAEVFVQGINEIYYYDATSALTADGLNVVNGIGPGQFIRGSTVIVQADWYVNSVTGNDQNNGTVGSPLQTLPELFRRWSGRALLSGITAATVHLSGSFTTQVLSLSGVNIQRGQSLVISGLLTTVASGSITAFTARNAATDTSATILANISFAGHAGRRIRLTSGANIGATATVLFDLGGNTCRVSGFGTAAGASISPVNGDTFDIETYDTQVGGCTIDFSGGGVVRAEDIDFTSQTLNEPFYISPFIQLSAAATFAASTGFFSRCRFSGSSMSFAFGAGFYCCTFATSASLRGGRYIFRLGAMVDPSGAGLSALNAGVSINDYFCFEGCPLLFDLLEGSVCSQTADLQVFRCSGSRGIQLSTSNFDQSASCRIYGGTNTFTNAFLVRSGSQFTYANKPTIVGSVPNVNDIKLGGVDLGWGGIPAITAANNAMAVARA